jgi:hypothetical protein
MSMNTEKIELTPDQGAALDRYARQHGPRWKTRLHEAWIDGNYGYLANKDDSAYLQQVRNTLGPTWLTTYEARRDWRALTAVHPTVAAEFKLWKSGPSDPGTRRYWWERNGMTGMTCDDQPAAEKSALAYLRSLPATKEST